MVMHNKFIQILPQLTDVIQRCKGKLDAKDSSLSYNTLISPDDPAIKIVKEIINSTNFHNLKIEESRALACFICAAVGDALGANTEFSPFCYQSQKKEDTQFNIKKFGDFEGRDKRSQLGQWTDDTSMALCLADSILLKKGEFDGIDIRYRYLLWWHYAYNSGCKGGLSFGLGGNIAKSFKDFHKNPTALTKKNKANQDNGNGSLMRLAPVPIYFHYDEKKALEFASNQSYTTHNGEEASECCRLMTYLILNLFKRDEKQNFREIFENLKEFKSNVRSVCYMASSCQEKFDEKEHPIKFNQSDRDRNWNWKSEIYEYSPFRYTLHPGYFASYCMDALALSLHYAYHSKSAEEAILRAVNAGGDSDTVAAITGQIVGAIYGLEKNVVDLYIEGVVKWDDYAIATTAYKLFHDNAIIDPSNKGNELKDQNLLHPKENDCEEKKIQDIDEKDENQEEKNN